jgi:hypothetical protein
MRSGRYRCCGGMAPEAVERRLLEACCQSGPFSGDRAIVERVRPSHWPAPVWEFHVADKTREFVQTDPFRLAYHEACIELEEQNLRRWRTVVA